MSHNLPKVCGYPFDRMVCVAPRDHDGPHITSNERFPHGLPRVGGSAEPVAPPPGAYEHHRANALAELKRRGFEDGKLQYLWRTPECFTRTYDMGEVGAAICDALTREGCTAWWGDGTSCVEQMIRLQWDRAVKAEADAAGWERRARNAEAAGLDWMRKAKAVARAPQGDAAAPLDAPWELVHDNVRQRWMVTKPDQRASHFSLESWYKAEAIAVRDALNHVAGGGASSSGSAPEGPSVPTPTNSAPASSSLVIAGSCPPAPSPTDSEIVEFVCEAYNAGRFDGDAAAVKFVREWLGLDRGSPMGAR